MFASLRLVRAAGVVLVALLVVVGLSLSQPFASSPQLAALRRELATLAGRTAPGSRSGARTAAGPTIKCGPSAGSGYQECTFEDGSGHSIDFLLHVPADYNPRQEYPLVLVLHGGMERAKPTTTAAKAESILTHASYVKVWTAPGTQAGELGIQERWPSFIVVPQLVYPNRWVDVPPAEGSYVLAAKPTEQLQLAKDIVDQMRKQYGDIDANRLYITGISLGGYGTWDAIERWPNYFAAAVPVSGAGDPALAYRLKNLPIWAFHGGADRIVPATGTKQMVDAIRAAGGHPHFTEYPDAGHEIWPRVYSYAQGEPSAASLGLFPWLFSQQKSGAGAVQGIPNTAPVLPGFGAGADLPPEPYIAK